MRFATVDSFKIYFNKYLEIKCYQIFDDLHKKMIEFDTVFCSFKDQRYLERQLLKAVSFSSGVKSKPTLDDL